GPSAAIPMGRSKDRKWVLRRSPSGRRNTSLPAWYVVTARDTPSRRSRSGKLLVWTLAGGRAGAGGSGGRGLVRVQGVMGAVIGGAGPIAGRGPLLPGPQPATSIGRRRSRAAGRPRVRGLVRQRPHQSLEVGPAAEHV